MTDLEWDHDRGEFRAPDPVPDIVDRLGRAWSWWYGNVYRHDSMAWPKYMIERIASWPDARLLDNPNYQWCDACRDHMIAQRDARRSAQ